MKKIYIHIGMHRTGTSTFQKFLELNIEKLNSKKIGVFMPLQYGEANSSEYFMVESRSQKQQYYELKSFLSKDYESFIISGEELSRFNYDGIAGLKSLLDSVANAKIKIICCIRQPNEYIDSAGAILIDKGGYSISNLISCDGLIPNYKSILDWHEHFGRNFEFFAFSDDTLSALLKIINIKNENYLWPKSENVSKCLQFIAIKGAINDPRFIQANELLNVFCDGQGDNKFIIPQEVALSICSDINYQVKLFNEKIGGLLDNISIYNRPKLIQYSDQNFLASCIRYLLESMVSAIPTILANGAIAYENLGRKEDGEFEPFGYLINNLDLCASIINPAMHYKYHGKSEGRNWFESNLIPVIEEAIKQK